MAVFMIYVGRAYVGILTLGTGHDRSVTLGRDRDEAAMAVDPPEDDDDDDHHGPVRPRPAPATDTMVRPSRPSDSPSSIERARVRCPDMVVG